MQDLQKKALNGDGSGIFQIRRSSCLNTLSDTENPYQNKFLIFLHLIRLILNNSKLFEFISVSTMILKN
jgi:hypothetical protein